MQDPACKKTAQPFCQYDSELVAKGVKIEDCDLSNADAVCSALSGEWDVVIDNNNKDANFAEKLILGCLQSSCFTCHPVACTRSALKVELWKRRLR